jgi:hypothetical protein
MADSYNNLPIPILPERSSFTRNGLYQCLSQSTFTMRRRPALLAGPGMLWAAWSACKKLKIERIHSRRGVIPWLQKRVLRQRYCYEPLGECPPSEISGVASEEDYETATERFRFSSLHLPVRVIITVLFKNLNVGFSPNQTADLTPPRTLAVDSQNNVYFTDDSYLYVISPDGTITALSNRLQSPDAVAIDAKDRLYILGRRKPSRGTPEKSLVADMWF